MQKGHLMKLGTSSNPGVTFSSSAGWGMGKGPRPRQGLAGMCHHGPLTSPTPRHLPSLFFKEAFASNAPERVELKPNKAVVICKLEMLQSAQD